MRSILPNCSLRMDHAPRSVAAVRSSFVAINSGTVGSREDICLIFTLLWFRRLARFTFAASPRIMLARNRTLHANVALNVFVLSIRKRYFLIPFSDGRLTFLHAGEQVPARENRIFHFDTSASGVLNRAPRLRQWIVAVWTPRWRPIAEPPKLQ